MFVYSIFFLFFCGFGLKNKPFFAKESEKTKLLLARDLEVSFVFFKLVISFQEKDEKFTEKWTI